MPKRRRSTRMGGGKSYAKGDSAKEMKAFREQKKRLKSSGR
jgi:hypothetical protein